MRGKIHIDSLLNKWSQYKKSDLPRFVKREGKYLLSAYFLVVGII